MKRLMMVVAVVAVALSVGSAQAAPKHHTPKAKKCKSGYRKVVKKRHGKRTVRCVKRRKKATATPPSAPGRVLLSAKIDRTPKRDPLNPRTATYSYSATASSETARGVEPSPLPTGVLSLYSNGSLECATNVGGAIDSAECEIDHPKIGSYRIVEIYTSGGTSATDSVTEVIGPLPTQTALGVEYEDLPPVEEHAKERWKIGRVNVTGAVTSLGQIIGYPYFGCGQGIAPPSCFNEGSQFVNGKTSFPVFAQIESYAPENNGDVTFGLSVENSSQFEHPKTMFSLAEAAAGTLQLHAAFGDSMEHRYLDSEANAPVQFSPHSLPGFYQRQELFLASTTDQFQKVATIATYPKTGTDTDLHLYTGAEAGNGHEGCLIQTRVNGVAASGDNGFEAGGTGVGKSQEVDFEGLPAGPVTIELWARYAGSGTAPDCGIREANFVVSEGG